MYYYTSYTLTKGFIDSNHSVYTLIKIVGGGSHKLLDVLKIGVGIKRLQIHQNCVENVLVVFLHQGGTR